MSYGLPSFPLSRSSNCIERLHKALRGDFALPILALRRVRRHNVHLVEQAE